MAITTKSALAAELGITRGRVSQYVAAGMPVRDDGKLDRETAIRWVAQHHYQRFGGDAGARRARQLIRDGYAEEPIERWRPTEADLSNLKLSREDFERWCDGNDVFD